MIKNKFILKSCSLFLSFWMLLASTGFSVNYHYCEGDLMNWSILNDANCDHEEEVETCCESELTEACHSIFDHELEKSDCCNSDQASMELESEFNLSDSQTELTAPQLIILSQFIFPVSDIDQQIIKLINCEAPVLIYRQEAPFIQSFLI